MATTRFVMHTVKAVGVVVAIIIVAFGAKLSGNQ